METHFIREGQIPGAVRVDRNTIQRATGHKRITAWTYIVDAREVGIRERHAPLILLPLEGGIETIARDRAFRAGATLSRCGCVFKIGFGRDGSVLIIEEKRARSAQAEDAELCGGNFVDRRNVNG